MGRTLPVVDCILAMILAMGKTEFRGDLGEALPELFRRHLDLLPEPRYLRYTPGKLTFEDELRSILFHLDSFSWTYEWTGKGSYVTHYRIENLDSLKRIVEEERRQNPDRVAQFENLAPELEEELKRTVEYRMNLSIPDPDDYP